MFFSRSKPPEAGARDESTSPLDLRRLENRLRVEDGVADPAKAISEYLDWLGDVVAGFKLDPTKFTQAPSLDVDKVWQRHQLDTRAYMQDCRALSVMHTSPSARCRTTSIGPSGPALSRSLVRFAARSLVGA